MENTELTARIYRITAPNLGKHYYGSTTMKLGQRLSDHKNNNNRAKRGARLTNCTSSQLLDDPNVHIIELEVVTGTKAEIAARERYWIDNNPCVNKNKPGRSAKEYMRDRKLEAGTVQCGCGGKYVNTLGIMHKHIATRMHGDWIHEKQKLEFKLRATA